MKNLMSLSGNMKLLFKGIINDFKGRAACYKQDWKVGVSSGFRILAPSTYIFFASALPVIAFGEQLSRDTGFSFFSLLYVYTLTLECLGLTLECLGFVILIMCFV